MKVAELQDTVSMSEPSEPQKSESKSHSNQTHHLVNISYLHSNSMLNCQKHIFLNAVGDTTIQDLMEITETTDNEPPFHSPERKHNLLHIFILHDHAKHV